MAANPDQIAISRDIRESPMRIPRGVQVTILLTCLVAGPFAVAWVSFHLWQAKANEKARIMEQIARSKADAEHKRYLRDFLDGLNSWILQSKGVHGVSRLGYELAGTCPDLWELKYESERRRALAHYLTTPTARKEAARLKIPADVLPAAAEATRWQHGRPHESDVLLRAIR